jgi:hypothetical protein
LFDAINSFCTVNLIFFFIGCEMDTSGWNQTLPWYTDYVLHDSRVQNIELVGNGIKANRVCCIKCSTLGHDIWNYCESAYFRWMSKSQVFLKYFVRDVVTFTDKRTYTRLTTTIVPWFMPNAVLTLAFPSKKLLLLPQVRWEKAWRCWRWYESLDNKMKWWK